MKRSDALFVALVSLFLTGSSLVKGMAGSTTHEQEREYFSQGQAALAFGKYDEAIDCFEKVLSLNPGFSDVHRFIGDAYMKKVMPDRAIAAYKKALDSTAQSVPALVGLGRSYFQKGMYAEAAAAHERALAMQPDSAASRIGLGDVYYEKGDPEKALAQYRKGLALEPDHADAQLRVGLILQKRGENDKAAPHFHKAGLLFLAQGDRSNALKAHAGLKQTGDERLIQLLHEALHPETE